MNIKEDELIPSAYEPLRYALIALHNEVYINYCVFTQSGPEAVVEGVVLLICVIDGVLDRVRCELRERHTAIHGSLCHTVHPVHKKTPTEVGVSRSLLGDEPRAIAIP